jgi:hypothetical protein
LIYIVIIKNKNTNLLIFELKSSFKTDKHKSIQLN